MIFWKCPYQQLKQTMRKQLPEKQLFPIYRIKQHLLPYHFPFFKSLQIGRERINIATDNNISANNPKIIIFSKRMSLFSIYLSRIFPSIVSTARNKMAKPLLISLSSFIFSSFSSMKLLYQGTER